jgi:hypothetical protein
LSSIVPPDSFCLSIPAADRSDVDRILQETTFAELTDAEWMQVCQHLLSGVDSLRRRTAHDVFGDDFLDLFFEALEKVKELRSRTPCQVVIVRSDSTLEIGEELWRSQVLHIDSRVSCMCVLNDQVNNWRRGCRVGETRFPDGLDFQLDQHQNVHLITLDPPSSQFAPQLRQPLLMSFQAFRSCFRAL